MMVTTRIEQAETQVAPGPILRYIPAYVLRQLPPYVVRSDRAVPLGLDGDVLLLAVENPSDLGLQERIRYIAGRELRLLAATRDSIDQAIAQYYPAFDEELDEELFAVDFGPLAIGELRAD